MYGLVESSVLYYYYPYGFLREGGSYRYGYNGMQREDAIAGAGNTYDFGARLLSSLYGSWFSIDPLAGKFSGWSPYNFVLGNPLSYIDPNGKVPMEVNISGSLSSFALDELQSSVEAELDISMSEGGQISYGLRTSAPLSPNAQQLVDAIDSKLININITAENTMITKAGFLYIGGAFMGNSVVDAKDGRLVTAEQEVNPFVLSKISNSHDKPGQDMLHEVTEAYQGALISFEKGISSPPGGQPGSVYPLAHKRATPQTGPIFQKAYDVKGKEMLQLPDGGYPPGINRVEWYVKNKQEERIIIQELSSEK